MLRKKTNSVLNSYRQEHQKVNTKSSGMGANEVCASTWFAYNVLSFSRAKHQTKSTKSTIEVSRIFFSFYKHLLSVILHQCTISKTN